MSKKTKTGKVASMTLYSKENLDKLPEVLSQLLSLEKEIDTILSESFPSNNSVETECADIPKRISAIASDVQKCSHSFGLNHTLFPHSYVELSKIFTTEEQVADQSQPNIKKRNPCFIQAHAVRFATSQLITDLQESLQDQKNQLLQEKEELEHQLKNPSNDFDPFIPATAIFLVIGFPAILAGMFFPPFGLSILAGGLIGAAVCLMAEVVGVTILLNRSNKKNEAEKEILEGELSEVNNALSEISECEKKIENSRTSLQCMTGKAEAEQPKNHSSVLMQRRLGTVGSNDELDLPEGAPRVTNS